MTERCECHECTQARWKGSLHGQIAESFKAVISVERKNLVDRIMNMLCGVTLMGYEGDRIINEVQAITHRSKKEDLCRR